MKHILLVTYEFPPEMSTGGIGSYMHHLAKLLHTHKFEVSVFSATHTGTSVRVIERETCINYLIPAKNLLEFRGKALSVFKEYQLQDRVMLIESPEVGACALEIKRSFPEIPLVVKLHTPGVLITKITNSIEPLSKKIRYVIGGFLRGKIDLGYWSSYDRNRDVDPEYQICVLADALLSPSQALKNWAVSFWKLQGEKIKVLPNPFTANEDLLHVELKRNTKTICFVGKLTVLKGMLAFTEAIKMVLRKYPEYRFILVGRDEPVSASIPSMQQWMVSRLGNFINSVDFKGALSRKEVNEILACSEICVVPSLWENYPTVVLEAMAAGCAVAASNRGGIPEIIVPLKTGLLFNAMNPSSIASAILYLIQNPFVRFDLTAKARIEVRRNNEDHFSEEISNMYAGYMKTRLVN